MRRRMRCRRSAGYRSGHGALQGSRRHPGRSSGASAMVGNRITVHLLSASSASARMRPAKSFWCHLVIISTITPSGSVRVNAVLRQPSALPPDAPPSGADPRTFRAPTRWKFGFPADFG